MSFQYENQFEYIIKMKKLCQKVLQLKRNGYYENLKIMQLLEILKSEFNFSIL